MRLNINSLKFPQAYNLQGVTREQQKVFFHLVNGRKIFILEDILTFGMRLFYIRSEGIGYLVTPQVYKNLRLLGVLDKEIQVKNPDPVKYPNAKAYEVRLTPEAALIGKVKEIRYLRQKASNAKKKSPRN